MIRRSLHRPLRGKEDRIYTDGMPKMKERRTPHCVDSYMFVFVFVLVLVLVICVHRSGHRSHKFAESAISERCMYR